VTACTESRQRPPTGFNIILCLVCLLCVCVCVCGVYTLCGGGGRRRIESASENNTVAKIRSSKSCFCSCVCALGEISINVVDLFADIGILVGSAAPRVALRCIGTIFTNTFYYIPIYVHGDSN